MKLLLLDKDGTLVETVSGAKFVNEPKDQKFLPGVAEAIAKYAADKWHIAIVSNQGGVAAGHKTIESTIQEMAYCLKLIHDASGTSDPEFGFFCPDMEGLTCFEVHWAMSESFERKIDWGKVHENADCHCLRGQFRKPSPGMLLAVKELYSADASDRILMVGDRTEDEDAAFAAKTEFMWAEDWRSNLGA